MKRALFLDRDGIVIRDSGYAKDAGQVALIPGIAEIIRHAHLRDWKVVIVTNQSGLGRGWISLDQYKAVSGRMHELLQHQHAKIDRVYFAPFYEPEDPGKSELRAPRFEHHGVLEIGAWTKLWRKPGPGMLWRAALDLDLDLENSILIGDRMTDQVAGALAGLAKTCLFKSDIYEDEMRESAVWVTQMNDLEREFRGLLASDSSFVKLKAKVPKGKLQLAPILIDSFAEVEFE